MISVITITYNNFDELIETLDSLKDQTEIESVVINGGACQKTRDFLLSQYLNHKTEKDRGISDAFNKGFQLSQGEFVTYLNSGDVLIDKSYYKEAVSFLKSHMEYDFVYADICFVDQYAGDIHVKSNLPLPHMPFLHPTLIVRRSAMVNAGLFNLDYRLAMDLDFAYRLVKTGAKGHYFPQMVVRMDGSGVSSKNYVNSYMEVLNIVRKNGDYSLRSILFLVKNGMKLSLKLGLLKSGGDKILGKYRKLKYQIKR